MPWAVNGRHVAALGCLALLALAGCTGSGTGTSVTPAEVPELTGAPGPAVTPTTTAPTTTERTVTVRGRDRRTAIPNASVRGVSFPPGTDGRGVVNPQALASAHARAAAEGGYVLLVNETIRISGGNESDTIEDTYLRYRVSQDGAIAVRARRPTGDGNVTTIAAYANETGVFTRRSVGGNVTYERSPGVDLDRVRREIAAGHLTDYLVAGDWRPVGTRRVGGGQAAVTFAFEPDSGNATDATGVLIATERGVVRLLQYRTVVETGGERRVTAVTYGFEPRPYLTVVPPEWVADVGESDDAVTRTRPDPEATASDPGTVGPGTATTTTAEPGTETGA